MPIISVGLTPFSAYVPSAAVIALARPVHTRAPTMGWPEALSKTEPRTINPPNAKWYQATPATSSTANGNGPTAGSRGRCGSVGRRGGPGRGGSVGRRGRADRRGGPGRRGRAGRRGG